MVGGDEYWYRNRRASRGRDVHFAFLFETGIASTCFDRFVYLFPLIGEVCGGHGDIAVRVDSGEYRSCSGGFGWDQYIRNSRYGGSPFEGGSLVSNGCR